jgi:YegS/Rv2252/BmrU family lipid kinase
VNRYAHPVIVLNPSKCDDPDRFRAEVDAAFSSHGLTQARWLDTTRSDPGRGQTEQAISDGADLVLACGGDGTVRACASVLAGGSVPLGLLPNGTGNLLARNLVLPRSLDDAIGLVADGTLRVVDVAELDGEVFAVMGGAGFDAQLFHFTSERLKTRIGWASYVVAGLRALRAAPPRRVTLTLDGAVTQLRAVGVIVGNVGTLTGGVTLLPSAVPDDGVLDVGVLTPNTPAHWVGLAVRLISGRHPQPWQLQLFRARAIHVAFGADVPVEVDGDLLGARSGFTVRVRPRALRVCAPLREPATA